MKKRAVIFAGIIGVIALIAGIVLKIKKSASVAIIGGADGPTSVFIAGKVGDDLSTGVIGIGVILLLTVIIILKMKKK